VSTLSNTGEATDPATNPRSFALSLFTQVLAGVDVTDAMREAFRVDGSRLLVGDQSITLAHFNRVLIAAIGKAAVPMVEHALATLRPVLPVRGVAVGVGPWQGPTDVQYVEGGHPVPDARSFAAAHALLQLLGGADAQTLVVFLISGGASAMAEAPLGPSVYLDELFGFYRKLLHSGLPIDKLNAVRKHLSAVKGGRLALACGAATRCTVLLSDVPQGALDVVGSGPSLPDTSTVAECRRIIAETPSLLPVSPALQAFFDEMPETPKVLPEGIEPSICYAALTSESLVRAAQQIARDAGYRVVTDNSCDDWDYRDAAKYLFNRAMTEAEVGVPVCIVSAGEVTVSIYGQSGIGGRNQQWALEIARYIDGREGFIAMSAGSDGIDGNSPAAGAIVDGSTWTRISQLGVDADDALEAFNTYPLLAQLGDAITCGPTGNNLRDLRVILVNRT
jgi:hydroxypyruvate reductase